jgi:CcmD family protein
MFRRGVTATILGALLCAAPVAAQEPSDALPPQAPPPLTSPQGPGERQQRGEPLSAPQGEPGAGQTANDGFVPISELPPDEQLPAAPMLVAAYAFVVVALFAYLLSLSRRLGAVTQEIARLGADVQRSRRP